MNLELIGVENAGELERERVVLKASADTDIGKFAIFLGKVLKDHKVAGGPIASTYWFPDKSIKAGDIVVLYSKDGAPSEKKGETGATSYFYYWGKTAPCWKAGTTPILVHTATWRINIQD